MIRSLMLRGLVRGREKNAKEGRLLAKRRSKRSRRQKQQQPSQGKRQKKELVNEPGRSSSGCSAFCWQLSRLDWLVGYFFAIGKSKTYREPRGNLMRTLLCSQSKSPN